MLEMVAHPVAVGANPILLKVAQARGWEHLKI
jgi:phosphoserine phosphatase